ncbi:MAG: hypothetical protein HQL45_10395 [Alphaproteobacteria bacterium]|nr:hypothetical protein [Alphaproteobacteria bacterium]
MTKNDKKNSSPPSKKGGIPPTGQWTARNASSGRFVPAKSGQSAVRGGTPRPKTSEENEKQRLFKKLMKFSEECSALPILDDRLPDEILGYGPDGLPH